jgi:hypothetical protein
MSSQIAVEMGHLLLKTKREKRHMDRSLGPSAYCGRELLQNVVDMKAHLGAIRLLRYARM